MTNNPTKLVLWFIVLIVLLGLITGMMRSVDKEVSLPTSNTATSTIMESSNELQISTIAEGAGEGAKAGNTVTVHYLGTLENGTKFDSSHDHGAPFSFTLGEGRVIPGWEQGILGMKVGEKRKLVIPGHLAYGPSGIPGSPIGPNATLVFEVEMMGIK